MSTVPVSTVAVAPRRRLAGWVPPLIGGIVFLLVLTGGGLVTADWLSRNVEMKTLVANVQVSESAMQATQDEVRTILDRLGDADGDGQLSQEEQQQMVEQSYDELAAAARDGQAAIAAAGKVISDQQIPLWHRDIQDAREAYLRHNRAWQAYLGRAADNPTEFLREQTEVNDSFKDAEPLFRRAIPKPALFDLREKVDTIFADTAPAEGDTQSA